MYVKNNDFYFSKDDYLHFDKLKFTVYDDNACNITDIIDDKDYDYAIGAVSLRANCNIYIDFHKVLKSSRAIKLLVTEDELRCKMSLLHNLKYVVSSIYNALLLCEQYVNFLERNDELNILIMFIDELYNKGINWIELYEGCMYLITDINNTVRQDNTIIAIIYQNINDISLNNIIIMNNIVFTRNVTIIHPKPYNIYYYKKMPRKINFSYNKDVFITKLFGEYYIRYQVPPPLLTRFIDNIGIFDNIKKVRINNEHDLLKYI